MELKEEVHNGRITTGWPHPGAEGRGAEGIQLQPSAVLQIMGCIRTIVETVRYNNNNTHTRTHTHTHNLKI